MQPDPSYEALLLHVAGEVNGIRHAATRTAGHLSADQCQEAKAPARECFERVEALAQRLLENDFSLERIPSPPSLKRTPVDTPEARELLARLEGLWELAAAVDRQIDDGTQRGSRIDRSDGRAEWEPDLHSGVMLLTMYLRCLMVQGKGG